MTVPMVEGVCGLSDRRPAAGLCCTANRVPVLCSRLDGEVVRGGVHGGGGGGGGDDAAAVVVCGQWRHYRVDKGACRSFWGCGGEKVASVGTLDSGASAAQGTGKTLRFPHGTFEMAFSALDGTATGWWLPEDHGDADRRPWRWKGLWLDTAVHGVAMTQFGVLAAWVFVLQTGCSLGLAVAAASGAGAGRAATGLNLGFNAIYTLLYAGFLLGYSRMRRQHKPTLSYHAGVGLYTAGYAAFLALYAVGYAESTVDTDAAAQGLYVAGSGLFLLGSVLLVAATIPVGQGCRRRWCGGAPADSLFWGSVLFLVGSGCFLLDSIWEGDDVARASCAVAGNTAFLLGRLFFLHGSCTDQCDALLRDRSADQHGRHRGQRDGAASTVRRVRVAPV